MALSGVEKIRQVLQAHGEMTSAEISEKTGMVLNTVSGLLGQYPYFEKVGMVDHRQFVWAFNADRFQQFLSKPRKPAPKSPVKLAEKKVVKKRFEAPINAKQKKDCLRALLQHSHIVGEQKDIIRGILTDYTGQL